MTDSKILAERSKLVSRLEALYTTIAEANKKISVLEDQLEQLDIYIKNNPDQPKIYPVKQRAEYIKVEDIRSMFVAWVDRHNDSRGQGAFADLRLVTGLSDRTMNNVYYGGREFIQFDTADKLLIAIGKLGAISELPVYYNGKDNKKFVPPKPPSQYYEE